MENNEKQKTDPVRLVDENDPSLTFLNTHADGRRDTRPLDKVEEDTSEDTTIDAVNQENGRFNEETAAEFAAVNGMATNGDAVHDETLNSRHEEEHRAENDTRSGFGIGTFAIVLSILSLFFLPVLLGAAGIIVGFVSRRYGAKAIGNWAIGIGALSIILTVFFSPFI
ncbi:hypothetical protein [Alkalihalobacillus trypoxylicola]|uniref:DUF4190 domain-containing protein n=1 Tax=Alkalihalobacillus trypoxylicola TaxID=519424 RepID=A0A162E8U8_9BACI|nr:hypothetical protein [Alkalihalobacillus trypoxylicola]KYG32065.1 hypothetical protein AZF04_04625 [Alkalihalobacillus trypoxylicola]GAF65926.1 hypothetical protein BTS2_2826 [Bacillus sp. TS-2]